MKFLFPMGLLALIGIPIIIIIYILQSKYSEQTVNSTYIWKLSDKFMKKRNPLSGITGLISLILQLLTVAVIALLLSRPIFTLPGAAKEYCFVLDSTSSMSMYEGKETRFDKAKSEIIKVINRSRDGSSFSLVSVSGEVIREFDLVNDKKTAIELVEKLQVSQSSTLDEELVKTAQDVFDQNTSTIIYLATDKGYTKHDNIEVIDVGSPGNDNYGIFDVKYNLLGGELSVDAQVASYNKDAEVVVKLSIDGAEATEFKFEVKAGEKTPINLKAPCTYFEQFKVELGNNDGYMLDNSVITYNMKSDKTYSILIVSDEGFFFEAVIDALVDSRVETVTFAEYEKMTETYGLYIFDSCTPKSLPDGAVWLINADESIPNSGFGVRGRIEVPGGDVISKSSSSATNVRHLLRGVGNSEIYLTKYVKYSGMYLNFHTLYTYESNPIIFAGANGLGHRQVVCGFDLHTSDFALTTDFVILMRNFLEYSFPNVIERTGYTVGEDAIVNIVANAENLKALSPSGRDIYIDTDGASALLALDEVGTYTISMSLGGVDTNYRIYSCADPTESEPVFEDGELTISGERTYSNIDGEYDPMTLLFICLAILFFADWGVYCYEKYQLR
ncbi:MAG: VWA domain-containing protein [Clostridia bacterium]|nr:VWA domain-containing protein [Clostridia bacterium]